MTGLRRRSLGWIVCAGLIGTSVSWSADGVPAGYRAIAMQRGIPHTVLYAVALAESGKRVTTTGLYRPWPWTLNVGGDGYFYATRLEAWQALRDWLDQGKRSIDIGFMQVNWRYHHERLGDPWQALDPYHNLRVGANILQDCYATERDWWASVGCYHAPANPEQADRYRRRVLSRWQRVVNAG
jgi:hypothetical protein